MRARQRRSLPSFPRDRRPQPLPCCCASLRRFPPLRTSGSGPSGGSRHLRCSPGIWARWCRRTSSGFWRTAPLRTRAIFWWLLRRLLSWGGGGRREGRPPLPRGGYFLVVLAAFPSRGGGGSAKAAPAYAAVLFYLLSYALVKLGAFTIVSQLGGTGEKHLSLDDYGGLSQRQPFVSAALSVYLLSLLGLPVTAGVFWEVFIFQSAVKSHLRWLGRPA